MAISARLKEYLGLERRMVDLDEAGDPAADELRDRMDIIWLGLSAEEREALNRRFGDDPEIFAGRVSPDALGRPSAQRRDMLARQRVRGHFARAA